MIPELEVAWSGRGWVIDSFSALTSRVGSRTILANLALGGGEMASRVGSDLALLG